VLRRPLLLLLLVGHGVSLGSRSVPGACQPGQG
jgi:hypothetical protein